MIRRFCVAMAIVVALASPSRAEPLALAIATVAIAAGVPSGLATAIGWGVTATAVVGRSQRK